MRLFNRSPKEEPISGEAFIRLSNKNLANRFCHTCGKKVTANIHAAVKKGYDTTTGQPIFYTTVFCPDWVATFPPSRHYKGKAKYNHETMSWDLI